MAQGFQDRPGDSPGGKQAPIIAGFQLLRRVGRGAMGTVYRARQLSVDRIVAVKILRPHLAKNKEFTQRFKEEAKAAAMLNHPNIVQAIDAGEDAGYYYFTMEFVDGETLHRWMLREGVIEEHRALEVMRDVAIALGHAHAQGIVHRDVKPGNIMISRDNETKLCDLGLARLRVEEEEMGTGTVARGAAVGTPYYISPEQAMGKLDVDCRSDIYSLGATLYRALVGRHAFDAPSPAEVMEAHVKQPVPWPKDHNPDLTENVSYLLVKMMAKKPEERYQTPQELLEDTEHVLAGEVPKSSVVEFEIPPARLTKDEREAHAMTAARRRRKKVAVRQLAGIREVVDHVASEESIPPHSIVRLLRGNLDETVAQTFLKYGILLLAEQRFHLARLEFRKAARLGADVSEFLSKLDALGAPPGMCYIPTGEFLIGPPDTEETKELRAFYMAANLVTNRKYHDFIRATGAPPPPHWIDPNVPEGMADYPVVNVTWGEANAYAEWASQRLPGIAEWEKAARGSGGRHYPWGDEFDVLKCNTAESGIGDMTVAGRYPRGVSPYGCRDMMGNVTQWCRDEGPAHGGGTNERAVCGVAYDERGSETGCWQVRFAKGAGRSRKRGFRCAMDI